MMTGNQVGVKNNQPDRQTGRSSGLTLIGYLIPVIGDTGAQLPTWPRVTTAPVAGESPGTDRQTGSLFDLC